MPIRIARLGSPQAPWPAPSPRWGRNQEAITEYDEVLKRSGASSLYGRMARLGKADTQAHSGQLDAAIATWKEMTTGNNDDLPVDAILIELTPYVQKGNTEEAKKTFTQIVDQHPNSPPFRRRGRSWRT